MSERASVRNLVLLHCFQLVSSCEWN